MHEESRGLGKLVNLEDLQFKSESFDVRSMSQSLHCSASKKDFETSVSIPGNIPRREAAVCFCLLLFFPLSEPRRFNRE